MQRAANLFCRLTGWRMVGELPTEPKLVLIVAPHTSNLDFPVGLMCGYASGVLLHWPYGFMAKDSLFRWPVGPVLRWLGGIPIDRSAPQDVVAQMVSVFERYERFLLTITPEGTRRRTSHWKSGFYRIASAARVPLVPVGFDYAHRECRFGPALEPSGNAEADLVKLRAFYSGITPKRPANAGEIRFEPPG
ncbi:MAG: lysophospholipid acyltransferase family protein [Gemmatimonadales bacterium]